MPDEPARNPKKVPPSRLRRGATMTGAAASVAARQAAGRVGRPGRSPERREAQLGRQQIAAAKTLVRVLGGMRGAAMKVGQTLSTVDLGLIPAEARAEVQQLLADLQQHAAPVAFDDLREVAEEDLGHPLGRAFADVDPEPLANASIGQVHRGLLHDGREVVLKVQYPGIAEAVHADMRNLRMGMKLLDLIAPGIDTRAITEELREHVLEELDYELEAENQGLMADAWAGHPFVVVPRPVTELCRERILVSEYVDGHRFDAIRDVAQERRDAYGEVLTRFYLSGPMRTRLLTGDPHPGNALFLDDGRVAFVDFGFFKRLSAVDVDQIVRSTRATHDGDAEALLRIAVASGALPPDRPELAEPLLERYRAIFGWLLRPGPRTMVPEATAGIMDEYLRLRDDDGFEALELPAEHFVFLRAVLLLLGQLGQLGATNPWSSIVGEWLFDDPPTTAMGLAEREWARG